MAEVSDVVSRKGFKAVHVNSRSLINKLPELECQFMGFDVIIATETWLSTVIPDSIISIEGYSNIRQDRGTVKKKNRGWYYLLY